MLVAVCTSRGSATSAVAAVCAAANTLLARFPLHCTGVAVSRPQATLRPAVPFSHKYRQAAIT